MVKKRLFIPTFITVIIVLSFVAAIGSKPAAQKALPIASSKDCQECHEEIFNHWKNTMHSMAIDDPIFKASYMESYFNTAGEAKFHCLRCHAPITLVNNDYDLKHEITKEGVNCDFCHSIKKVNLDNRENPFELDIGEVIIHVNLYMIFFRKK